MGSEMCIRDRLQAVHSLHGEWRRRIQDVFTQWAHLQPAHVQINVWRSQPELSQDLQQRLDELQRRHGEGAVDDTGMQNLYTLIGSIKGLLQAMEELQESMQQINWNQWAAARF